MRSESSPHILSTVLWFGTQVLAGPIAPNVKGLVEHPYLAGYRQDTIIVGARLPGL